MGDAEPVVAFHGTPRLGAVLRHGLKARKAAGSSCVWMALDPVEAAHYGRVVAIDLDQLDGTWPREPDGSLCWQAHYDRDIPPEALERFAT